MSDEEIKNLIKAMQAIAIDGILYSHSFINILKKNQIDSDESENTLLIRFFKKALQTVL